MNIKHICHTCIEAFSFVNNNSNNQKKCHASYLKVSDFDENSEVYRDARLRIETHLLAAADRAGSLKIVISFSIFSPLIIFKY